MKMWCIKLSLLSTEGEGREEKVEGWACWKDVGELLSWDRQPSTRGHREEDDTASKASVEERSGLTEAARRLLTPLVVDTPWGERSTASSPGLGPATEPTRWPELGRGQIQTLALNHTRAGPQPPETFCPKQAHPD